MIRIFYASVEEQLSTDLFSHYQNSLPHDIRNTISKYINWKDRHLVLYGKLLLQEGLKRFGYQDVQLASLKYTQFKKPYFENEIDFNISHSGNNVVCVISDKYRVGIDIEEITPIDIMDFRSQWTEKEWACIINSENKYYEFFKFWTRKEAVIKADGKGLHIPLSQIEVITDTVLLGAYTWSLKEIEICDRSIAYLASNTPPEQDSYSIERLFF